VGQTASTTGEEQRQRQSDDGLQHDGRCREDNGVLDETQITLAGREDRFEVVQPDPVHIG